MKARVGYATLVAVVALAIGYGAERYLVAGLSFDALLTLRHLVLGDRHHGEDGPVSVVTIEESTFAAAGFRDVPWALWGPQFATVLDALDRAEAKVIGVDIIFSTTAETVVPGRDRPLMEVLRRLAGSGRIVLAQTDAGGRVLSPHPIFSFLVAHQKSVRSANVSIGRDGIVRSVPLWQASADPSASAAIPAFALTVAERAGFDSTRLPPEVRRLLPNYGDAVLAPTFVMEDVFACAREVLALKAAFAGKVVLIGGALDVEDRKAVSGRFFVSDAGDPRSLPCAAPRSGDGGKRRTIPGVFIHAQAVNDLLRWELARLWPDCAALLAFAVMSAAGSGLSVFLRASAASLSFGGTLLLWIAGAVWSASLDWFAPLLGVVASGTAAFLIGLGVRNFVIDRERRRIAVALSRYLDFRLARQLMASDKPPELGGEVREVTVWFSDIAGFSTLAERMDAKELVGRLNRHFSLVAEAIEAEGGIVDKYVGDSVVAIFGAPAAMPDHAARAMRAALLVRGRVQAQAAAPGGFRIRIGLNSGPCVVGNVGSHRRFDYTAIGDTVNVGQRLEAANKEFGTVILASEATVRAAGSGFAVRPLGSIPVKGRAVPVTAYEVLALS